MRSFYILVTVALASLFCRDGDAKVNTGDCVFDKYNKDHELLAVEKIRGLIGKTFTSQDSEGKWEFTVGICANLRIDGADDNAGAIQKDISSEGKKEDKLIHNIGSLRNTHLMAGNPGCNYPKFNTSICIHSDSHFNHCVEDWALLEYKDGETYGSHCLQEPKRTVVMLSCDESIDTSDAKMIHIEEESNKQEGCYYLFEMKHKALCPKASASVLSVGSILLITFLSVLACYLLIGFLYQRFVLGSKGIEQIPNYEFWKDLGNLEADGCNFVCRSKGRQSTGFRGLGDDQLDATEELRDDNLLPM